MLQNEHFYLTIRINLFDPVSLFVFIYDTIQVKPHCFS